MSESLLTLDQVHGLGVLERCDYLNALPERERFACLRALSREEQALYLGELARRNLEEHRLAAMAALG
jgi:hypothetical protein